MTYRTLHIALLVLLITLDIAMINMSGVAAFWLRCRTALFDEPVLENVDLRTDDFPFVGVANRAVYRYDSEPWVSLADDTETAADARVLEIDFRTDVLIYEVILGVRGSNAEARVTFGEGPKTILARPDSDRPGAIILRAGDQTIRSLRVALSDSTQFEGHLEVVGVNAELPALLALPVTDAPEGPYWYLLYVWNGAAILGLALAGAYRITRSIEVLDDFLLALRAVALATVSVIVVLFLYRGYQEATYVGFEYSRLVVIFGAAFATILLAGNRAIVDALHASFLRRGVGIRKVVVVGAGSLGQSIVDRLRTHYWLAFDPVAFVDDNPGTHGDQIQGLKVMGGTDILPRVAESLGTNEVIVALPNSSHKSIRDIVGQCRTENLNFHILPDLFEVISSDVRIGAIDGVPVLDLDDHYLGEWDRLLKRGLDVLCVVVGGIALLPLWLVTATLIKLGSRGPVLYSQSRVGENGKAFSCYKFRTMRVVALEQEKLERQKAYADLIQGEGESAGKIVNLDRVTWIGRFLRKYRLDEFPQIINVLRGDMSLVGPRPPIPYEVEHYNVYHLERLKGKPGVTGLWQVSGGAALTFEEMVKLDIFYLKNWSLWLDFKILAKTVPVVLSGKGA